MLSGTEQLLAAVPHLLGYHPRRSVVLVATAPGSSGSRSRRHAVLTARLDLPPCEDADVVVDAFAGPLARAAAEVSSDGADGEGDGPDETLLLHVFVHDAPPPVADAVAQAAWTLATSGGHGLHDLLLVREGHYLPLVAHGELGARILRLVLGLGPAPGLPDADVGPVLVGGSGTGGGAAGEGGAGTEDRWLPVPGASEVPGIADLVLRGRGVLPARDDVVAAVRRHDEPAAAATQEELDRAGEGPPDDPMGALGRLGRWVADGDDEPDAAVRAAVVVALSDRTLRDAVLARWLPELFSVADVLPADLARELSCAVPPWPAADPGALHRLLGLAAGVPRPVSAPLLTLAAAVAWGLGEGTVANEAVDLALEVDPCYRLALLVQAALEGGVPPWRRRARAA